ncbi:MCE family protein [Mycobacterium sp. URHB0044]|jgi:phospholipid/cholesterol/gamma-HCH transport system substrate-binding protein|uniref:MCE family protein n=1 Tax=Mycobacterium sp. URHB0044 TaxID=1380386 RepID=UPI00048D7233|nr:MlaD family protein [Mycobacterium sp. URHB0044]
MKDNLAGAVGRLVIFTLVCALGFFAMMLIFAQMRFQDERTYRATFTDVSGLAKDDFVRIAGVEVGQVKSVSIEDSSVVSVEFSAADSVTLTEGTRAAVRWADVFGGRYLSLEEGAGGVKMLKPGETIPTDRTLPALDLDSLIGGFRPLFRALDPEQVNALSGQLIAAFQGQGTTVNSFLAQTAAVTSTLADRDELIGQVISNLDVVLGSLGDQTTQLDKAVTSLSELVQGLADRKTDISDSVAHTNAAAGTVADLLQQARPPAQKVVAETDRAAGIVVADHEYFDDLLNTLPDAYQILGRQAIYGDFLGFYLCDLVFKFNGKGGQPVYTKIAGQTSGRCAPR